jgi:hypothetical protein
MTTATMKVTIPGVVGIYEVPLNEETWNGFAVPAFTLAQVRQLAAEFAASPSPFPEEDDVLHVDEDGTVWVDVAHSTHEDYEPDADGRYAIGAFQWAWEFTYNECAVCGTDIQISLSGDTTAHHATDIRVIVAFTCSTPCADTYETRR